MSDEDTSGTSNEGGAQGGGNEGETEEKFEDYAEREIDSMKQAFNINDKSIACSDLIRGAFSERELSGALRSTELNAISKEEIVDAYIKFLATKSPSEKAKVTKMILALATFIYVNGIHENLRGSLKAGTDLTWRELKEYWDFRSSNKSMRVRWVAETIFFVHKNNTSETRNLFFRQAAKWGLEKELEAIPKEYQYFGAIYSGHLGSAGRKAWLAFQDAVIKNTKK